MIKIISKKKYENLLDRIDDLTLDLDYIQGEKNKLEDQVKIFNEDNKNKAKVILELTEKLDNQKKEEKKKINKLKSELKTIYANFPDIKEIMSLPKKRGRKPKKEVKNEK